MRDQGHRVVCVTATRGEAADPGSGSQERAQLALVRSAELERALATLGVEEHHWLDLPDGACAEIDPDVPVTALTAMLDEVRPDTVITFGPDGFTGHPDHIAVSRWAGAAVARSSAAPELLHAVTTVRARVDPELDEDFGVFELGQPRICEERELSVHLELSGAALDRKVEALLQQPSQTSALVDAVGLERFRAWVATESFAARPTA
jgi:LmbE family N-acetylglucosaminyl deacetylase